MLEISVELLRPANLYPSCTGRCFGTEGKGFDYFEKKEYLVSDIEIEMTNELELSCNKDESASSE